MQTVSRPERSGCDTFWTIDKKQFNLDFNSLVNTKKKSIINENNQKKILKIKISGSSEIFCEKTA